MTKYSSKFLIISSIVIAFGFITSAYVFWAYDIEKAKQLKYPIGELGGCGNFEECKTYCNKDENIPKCNSFSIKNGLLTKEEVADTERLISLMDESGLPGKCENAIECFSYCESAAHLDECWDYTQRHNLNHGYDIETIRRLAKLAREGARFPGDCQGQDQCQAYCENSEHIDECLAFAEKAGLFPPDELEETKKVAPFIKSGETPGGCKSKAKCETYCSSDTHIDECVAFAEKTGLISKDEAEQAKKVMPYMARGETPGKCTSKNQCEKYCSESNHMEECIAFAEKTGILKGEELEQAKKVAPFLARGETPGGCKSKDECENYCQGEGHNDECIAFGEKVGFISKEDAEMARKTGGKGPGNCKSKESCEAFCTNPANQQTCMDFMKEHGMEDKMNQKKAEVEQEFQTCNTLSSCSDFLSCIQGLQAKFSGESPSTKSGRAGGEQRQKQEQGQESLPSDVQTKLNTCIAEMKKGSGGKGGEGNGQFPSGEGQQQFPTPGEAEQNHDRGVEECTKQGGTWDGKTCQIHIQQPSPEQYQQSGGQIPQEYCSSFTNVPKCEYVGPPDSQNYKYCKQCFPDK